ncbi:unnamed protein product, partial [Gulo gulo]
MCKPAHTQRLSPRVPTCWSTCARTRTPEHTHARPLPLAPPGTPPGCTVPWQEEEAFPNYIAAGGRPSWQTRIVLLPRSLRSPGAWLCPDATVFPLSPRESLWNLLPPRQPVTLPAPAQRLPRDLILLLLQAVPPDCFLDHLCWVEHGLRPLLEGQGRARSLSGSIFCAAWGRRGFGCCLCGLCALQGRPLPALRSVAV